MRKFRYYIEIVPKDAAAFFRRLFGRGCTVCGYPLFVDEHYCIDHWPGYDLCKACNDYRCEHGVPTEDDISNPEYTSCHCGNQACRSGFVEGSQNRVVNVRGFAKLKASWK